MDNKLEFRPRARMLLQLGDQLIRNESIALLEIVKNSYDANATSATISMKNVTDPEHGEISIEDDGDGMNAEIIRNVWMQPGSEYKERLISKLPKDSVGHRMPIGGKGIGRFGVHKLGHKIELISKRADSKEITLKINWRDFQQDKLLEEIKVDLIERDTPKYFTNGSTGTKIIIRELRNTWSRGNIRDLYRAINSLNSPFETAESFRTFFKLDNDEWLRDLTNFKDIKNHALYYAEAEIEGEEIKTLKYEFRPWDTMDKVQARSKTTCNIKMVEHHFNETNKKKTLVPLDLSTHQIGKIKLKVLIFDRSAKILSLGVSDKKGFKDYLDINGGIRVFRSDVRVYDYGEPENDWLNLDIMRVNQPGKAISNNLIIGAVSIERSESVDLEEKTNREGFIENEAYRKFVSAIRFTLEKILTQRNEDKDLVRKFYGLSSSNQPVLSHLKELQEKVSERVTDTNLKNDLLKSISNIEKDYEVISDIYIRSSSAGLSLSIVMHEIIHMITELAAAIEHKPSDDHVKMLVKTLQKTVGDYAGVIKQSNKTKGDLIKIVRQSLSNIQFRIKAHDVEIISKYEERKNLKTEVSCAQNLITSTIINAIDNSIWWQTYAKKQKKKIFLDIIEYPEKHLSLIIADNGPGMSISPADAVKPFVSDKPGGMGLGLHLADEVMKGQKGKLIFPEPYDLDIPDEFQKGAIILLAFRKML